MSERTESRVLFLLSAALTVFGVFAPYQWHDMPGWITDSALFVALFLFLCAVGLALPARAKGAKKLLATILIAGGISALIAGVVLYFDKGAFNTQRSGPDVVLHFVYPDRPAVVLTNSSDKLAKQIKWTVVLWNLDDPRTFSNNPHAPDAHEPLPIPIATFDFIRPHSGSGPQAILGAPIAGLIKSRDRLVGSASVVCPDCDRGHTYVVSTQVDVGGWFAEVDNVADGNVVIPHKLTEQYVADFAKSVESIRKEDRIPIANP